MAARRRATFRSAAIAACALFVASRANGAPNPLERFIALATDSRGYAVRMESHEELGDRSDDAIYFYVSKANGDRTARVLEGRGAGYTITSGWIAHRARSLRGNDLAGVDLATLARCMRAHPAEVSQQTGPRLDGIETTTLVFARANVTCPGDSTLDRALTYDVIDVSASGEPVLRKRYLGREVVERVRFRDFARLGT